MKQPNWDSESRFWRRLQETWEGKYPVVFLIHSLTHSFNKHSLSSNSMPGIALGGTPNDERREPLHSPGVKLVCTRMCKGSVPAVTHPGSLYARRVRPSPVHVHQRRPRGSRGWGALLPGAPGTGADPVPCVIWASGRPPWLQASRGKQRASSWGLRRGRPCLHVLALVAV